jgi:ribose transport system ATP-binding protein
MRGITKAFPGVLALNNVSFSVERGKVHALVGENGAGKSTLMKILNGVLQADSGNILVDNREVKFRNTADAQNAGIGFVFQEFNLINELSAAENIFLNRYQLKNNGLIDWNEMYKKAQIFIDSLGFKFNVKRKVIDLSASEKQLVEIAKALSLDAKVIVFDEPTSSLAIKEVNCLFENIRKLKEVGVTIIYISHKLDEIFNICDMVTVLRDGEVIDTKPIKELSRDSIIEMMVGRKVGMEFPKRISQIGEVVLEVENLCSYGYLKNISFKLHKGEVLGIGGLVGAGRTELAETIFGAVRADSGSIKVKGEKALIRSPNDGIRNSIGMLTENRKETGLFLSFNVANNITVTKLSRIIKNGILRKSTEKEIALDYIEKHNIRTPSWQQKVLNLSGGNQQKVVVSKWLFSGVDILILDEPTRGIDVGAKYEMYLQINRLVADGKSIILITSELPELVGLSDRIIVLADGIVKGELTKDAISPEAVMRIAVS